WVRRVGHVAQARFKASHGSFFVNSSGAVVVLDTTSASLPGPPLAAISYTPGPALPSTGDSGGGFFRGIVPRNDKDLPGENEIRVANLLAVSFIDQGPHEGIVIDLFTCRNTPQRIPTLYPIAFGLRPWRAAGGDHTGALGQFFGPQTVGQGSFQA